MPVYIYSISHISNQEPLSEKWFSDPIIYNERYIRSIEPDYSAFIAPMAARRMGKVLKRALATALSVIRDTAIENPDAIITGTGLGCIENTEKFLVAMLDNNEELLPPTFFMQSTHNTISSQIAVHLKCNGYNSTYSHRGTSFDSALLDAFMQFELSEISSAMVNAHDELTPDYFKMLEKIGYWKEGEISEEILRKGDSKGAFAGECSTSFMLGNDEQKDALCQLKAIEILYQPTMEQIGNSIETILTKNNLTIADIDAVVVGISGDEGNDLVYKKIHSELFSDKPLIWYKHIFGESYSASSLGLYVGATILKQGMIPQYLLFDKNKEVKKPKNILVYNHFQNKDHSVVLLTSS